MGEQWGPGGPGRALTIELECRTSKQAGRGKPHPVTITADWRFESPHDLEAERIAMAFGGFTSCVGVAEHAVPALHESVRLAARIAPPPVSRGGARGWMLTEPVSSCECARRFFSTAQVAATHARDPHHLARKYDADPRLLASLASASAAASAAERPLLEGADSPRGLVRESDGLARLWGAGVHPDRVPEMAALVPGCDEPLPVAFYLGVATRTLDRAWLAETLSHRPDPDTAAWVAWCDEAVDPRHDDEYGAWLSLGVPVRGVEALVAARVPVSAAGDLSAATGHRIGECARVLAVWAEAGCQPSADDLAILDRHGVHRTFRPPVTAINLLEAIGDELPDPPTRTDLAVMLAIAGTRVRVIGLLERGVRSAADAADLI